MGKLVKMLQFVILLTLVLLCCWIDGIFRPVLCSGTQDSEGNSRGNLELRPEIQTSVSILYTDNRVELMELDEYVFRVVLGEVSADFHMEALKAQAIAARTYTLRCVLHSEKHEQGSVCTDYRCCQAYCEPSEYLKFGGTKEGLGRIKEAVDATAGKVLCYGNELICATYFSSSGGITEDAKYVWGERYPYLKSVSSPGEEYYRYYNDKIVFTATDLQKKLSVNLSGKPEQWFGMVMHTPGQGIALMRIGGKLYTGIELRQLLALRSTIIEVTVEKENIVFSTRGYGHRVGMSQHGANVMAKQGKTCEAILLHYYTDVTLCQYRDNND